MLKAHQEVNEVLNGFLKDYNITRAFSLEETPFVPGVKKIHVSHNEEGVLKFSIDFLTAYNEVCKMVVHYCIVNSVNKTEELSQYFNDKTEGKK